MGQSQNTYAPRSSGGKGQSSSVFGPQRTGYGGANIQPSQYRYQPAGKGGKGYGGVGNTSQPSGKGYTPLTTAPGLTNTAVAQAGRPATTPAQDSGGSGSSAGSDYAAPSTQSTPEALASAAVNYGTAAGGLLPGGFIANTLGNAYIDSRTSEAAKNGGHTGTYTGNAAFGVDGINNTMTEAQTQAAISGTGGGPLSGSAWGGSPPSDLGGGYESAPGTDSGTSGAMGGGFGDSSSPSSDNSSSDSGGGDSSGDSSGDSGGGDSGGDSGGGDSGGGDSGGWAEGGYIDPLTAYMHGHKRGYADGGMVKPDVKRDERRKRINEALMGI